VSRNDWLVYHPSERADKICGYEFARASFATSGEVQPEQAPLLLTVGLAI
jgi:hypothetical protein